MEKNTEDEIVEKIAEILMEYDGDLKEVEQRVVELLLRS